MPLLLYRKYNVLKLSAFKCLYFWWRQRISCPLLAVPLNVLLVMMTALPSAAVAPLWPLPQTVMSLTGHYLLLWHLLWLLTWLTDLFAYSKLSFPFDSQLFPCAVGLLFQIQTKPLSIRSSTFWIQTTPET